MARLSDVAGGRADSAPHYKDVMIDDGPAISSHPMAMVVVLLLLQPIQSLYSARTPRASRYSPEGNFSDVAQISFWDDRFVSKSHRFVGLPSAQVPISLRVPTHWAPDGTRLHNHKFLTP